MILRFTTLFIPRSSRLLPPSCQCPGRRTAPARNRFVRRLTRCPRRTRPSMTDQRLGAVRKQQARRKRAERIPKGRGACVFAGTPTPSDPFGRRSIAEPVTARKACHRVGALDHHSAQAVSRNLNEFPPYALHAVKTCRRKCLWAACVGCRSRLPQALH